MKYWLFIFLLFFNTSCLNTLAGHRGVCEDIKESKERGVFIYEIHPLKKNYYINDTLSIYIKSAWVEKQWAYSSEKSITLIDDSSYQLIIESNKKSLTGFRRTWQVGNNFGDSYRKCSKSAIMIDLDSTPNEENLIWLVTKGRRFDSTQIIGKFDLRSNK